MGQEAEWLASQVPTHVAWKTWPQAGSLRSPSPAVKSARQMAHAAVASPPDECSYASVVGGLLLVVLLPSVTLALTLAPLAPLSEQFWLSCRGGTWTWKVMMGRESSCFFLSVAGLEEEAMGRAGVACEEEEEWAGKQRRRQQRMAK